MIHGAFLWYLNRGTGFVILALFTLTTVLGVLATAGRAGRGIPRFVTQAFHRNVALLSVVVLGVHVATAVADSYVDIRWWQALLPWLGSTYQPLWLGLGTLSLDLLLVVTLTSLLRTRLGHRSWRAVHLLAYAAWAAGLVHGLGVGTDVRAGAAWAQAITIGSIGAVAGAAAWRLGSLVADRYAARPLPVGSRR